MQAGGQQLRAAADGGPDAMSNTDFGGYGQIDDDDPSSDLTSIIAIARQLIARIDTIKIVKVLAVHPGSGTPPTGGTVDVKILVNQIDGMGNPVQHDKVNGIQVFRMQAGPWAIVMDPAVGDKGIVVCADRDSSLAVKNNDVANPGSRRRHNVADGIYIGGVASMNSAPTGWLQFNLDGTWSLTDKNGNVLQGSSNGITLTPGGGGVIKVDGNLQVTGTIIGGEGGGDQVNLATHTHSGVQTGGGTSGPPTPGS